MLRSWCLASVVLFSASARSADSPAQDFRADVVERDAHGDAAQVVAHLYAAHGRVRIELTELPDSFFLIDRDAPSALLVRPGQRIYANARQSSTLTQVFVPIDVANPCAQWRSAFSDALDGRGVDDWRCKSVPPASARAAKMLEFRTTTDRSVDRRIVDAKLQFPVKLISADGTSWVLENLHFAPQSVELFVVPSGYHAFDPRALIERIKQSDVWAAPPDK